MVCVVGDEVEEKYVELFPKYWNVSHFLMGNEVYIYKGQDLSHKELYSKKRLTNFVKDMGYLGGVTPQDEPNWEFFKCLINTRMLMDIRTKEERNIIFGMS